jgi:hypothetical protein
VNNTKITQLGKLRTTSSPAVDGTLAVCQEYRYIIGFMQIRSCPECGGKMAITTSSYDGTGRKVIQCGEYRPMSDEEFKRYELNGNQEDWALLVACGFEEELSPDIVAQLENRPRLF